MLNLHYFFIILQAYQFVNFVFQQKFETDAKRPRSNPRSSRRLSTPQNVTPHWYFARSTIPSAFSKMPPSKKFKKSKSSTPVKFRKFTSMSRATTTASRFKRPVIPLVLCGLAVRSSGLSRALRRARLKKTLKNISGTYVSPGSGCVGKKHSVGYVELVFGCMS